MMYEIEKMPSIIDIGYTGEIDFRTVQIDMTAWVEKVPAASPILMYVKPGEHEPYPVDITYEDNIITWSVTDEDLGTREGTGLLQVWFGVRDEDQVLRKMGMSAVVATMVHLSLAGEGYNTSTVQIPWLTEITEIKNAVLGYDYEAEAWAVGQRGGEDVSSDDPAYENNSKYFAEQAEAAKTVAVEAKEAAEAILPTTITEWLETNITSPEYPLDRSLSLSTAATPADMTGDLKSALNDGRTSLTDAIESMTMMDDMFNYNWSFDFMNGGLKDNGAGSPLEELNTGDNLTKRIRTNSAGRTIEGYSKIVISASASSWCKVYYLDSSGNYISATIINHNGKLDIIKDKPNTAVKIALLVAQDSNIVITPHFAMENITFEVQNNLTYVKNSKDSVDDGYYVYSGFVNGSFTNGTGIVSNAKRLVSNKDIKLNKGDYFICKPTANIDFSVYMFDTNTYVTASLNITNGWVSSEFGFTAPKDGYILLIVRKPNDGNISPSDYDATAEVYHSAYKNSFEVDNNILSTENGAFTYSPYAFFNSNWQNGSGYVTTNADKRLCSAIPIRVHAWDEIDYTIGANTQVNFIVCSDKAFKTMTQNAGGWFSANGKFVPSVNGYMLIMVRKPNDGSIKITDYDCTVTIKNSYAFREKNHGHILNGKQGLSNYSSSFYLNTNFDGVWANGICMVHGLLFVWGGGDEENENYVKAKAVNPATGEVAAEITHNFGHMNAMAYDERKDTLVFGNCSGSYTLAGKFYVYEGFYEAYNGGTTQFSISDCIEYDCAGVDGMSNEVQFNAIWGDFNRNGGGRYVILITNDNQIIRVIQLGMGTNDLGEGSYTATESTKYNGSYKVINKYIQYLAPVGDATGKSVEYCVQGASFYNGKIYVGIGHGRYEYWIMNLNDLTGEIDTERFFRTATTPTGEIATIGVGAIEATEDKLYIYDTYGYISAYNRLG